MSIEAVTDGGELVAVRINGHQFDCDCETGEAVIPKSLLTGFRLSEIPDGIVIKPVEAVDGNTIHIKNNFGLFRRVDGSASALVEEMFRRKFWDGEVGLSPHVTALRQAIHEHADTAESDFEDDGDYIFLHYEIVISENLEIQEAIQSIDAIIDGLEQRTNQLVNRRRDPLLGLFDRGSFDADLAYGLQNSESGVALIMADIDHFKNVNDTYGHQSGDSVLRAVAKTLSSRCDSTDRIAYRYGGEELAVVLTGVTEKDASEFAESIRTDIESLDAAPGVRVTISLGVSATSKACSPDDLVKRADEALYQAKRAGRNCVKTSHPAEK